MIWRDRLPVVRGRLLFDEPLGPFTWFRVGGPADVLFLPQDEDDLADFLMALGPSVPVTVSYRKSARASAEPLIFLGGLFQGRPDDPVAVESRMAEITARREQTQPIREKTGGSTFKNPPGQSSWKLVDKAGWRGKVFSVSGQGGGAMFSPLHANFLINIGDATAADLEGLGEAVRADVKDKFGVDLEWEFKRIGRTGQTAPSLTEPAP